MSEVLTEREGAVLTITLNRPDVFNAFNSALHGRLREALEEAGSPEVRAVVITGAGLCFAAGGDFRVAADAAPSAPGFTGIGLTPDSGGSWFIHRLLGYARAFEWMTSNRRLTAAEAHAWGLVSEV